MKLTHPASNVTVECADAHAPAYLSQGWREATTDAPKGNATRDEWAAFALTQGLSEDDVAPMSRDELRAALS